MYSIEERSKAIELAKQIGVTKAHRLLGYPTSSSTLSEWVREFNKKGKIECSYGCTKGSEHFKEGRKRTMYSKKRINEIVLEYLKSNLSLKDFSRGAKIDIKLLRTWISKYGCIGEEMLKEEDKNEEKLETLDDYKKALKETNEELMQLRRELEIKEAEKKIIDRKIIKVKKELETTKDLVKQAQMEYDILLMADKLLKKERGISIADLLNKEKAIVVNALERKYGLKNLLEAVKLAKSSYFYQLQSLKRDKYKAVRRQIRIYFNNNMKVYGYRRIYGLFKEDGIKISSRVVLRLMNEENIHPFVPKVKKYSSYKGEISPEVADLYTHDFHSDQPYQKMVTDITEFSLCDGKVYLSPMIDLYDGSPVNWKIGISPNKDMVATMLDEFKKIVPGNVKSTIHTDRGWHYRVPDWIDRMEEYGFARSMSRKGCSADNSACEGFFGILKREFFYSRNWKGIKRVVFMKKLNDFLIWFENDRIKTRLGFKSPADYRKMAS